VVLFCLALLPLRSWERAGVRGKRENQPTVIGEATSTPAPLASFRHPRARRLAHFPASRAQSRFSVGFDWVRLVARSRPRAPAARLQAAAALAARPRSDRSQPRTEVRGPPRQNDAIFGQIGSFRKFSETRHDAKSAKWEVSGSFGKRPRRHHRSRLCTPPVPHLHLPKNSPSRRMARRARAGLATHLSARIKPKRTLGPRPPFVGGNAAGTL